MPDKTPLKQITVYLPSEEFDKLEQEAADEGRTGASAQIRWILSQRRRNVSAS